MPQPGPWQQSGFNDMQSLQQHIMLKKMQELQRQHQLNQFNDARQQNYFTKQSSGGEYPHMINGEPLHDTSSQIYMNSGQHSASPALQQLFSQEQGSMGTQVPQQELDGSLYGTPVTNSRGNLNQYPHFQGISNDHGSSLVNSAGHQALQPMMNSSSFNTSFLGEQGFPTKTENLSENFQHVNTHTRNASLYDSNWREETLTQNNPQSSAKLDPLEEKILFGTNDNTWDPSFDGGSWSALMQSAVADVPSSDTVPHEEWNSDRLTHNQPSNFVGSVKQHANNSNFGIQQPNFQFLSERKEGVPHNFAHGSTHRALSIERSKQAQSLDNMRDVDVTMRHIQNENISNEHRESSNVPQYFVALQHSNTTQEIRDNVPSSARDSRHVTLTHQESPKQGSQGLPNYRRGLFGQTNVYDNVSNSAMDHEKRQLPEFHGASEAMLFKGNIRSNTSASFDRENRPELYQNINQLRKGSPTTHLGSGSIESQSLSQFSKVESSTIYNNQLYNQSSASQGFGLRLAPPHERVDNPNLLLSSQSSPKTGINLNSRQFNQGFGEKAPIQAQHASNSLMEFQSLHAFSGPSNIGPTQDMLRTSNENSLSHVSEPEQVTQSSIMSQQGEASLKQHNVWTNIPIRQPSSDAVTHEVLSPNPSNFNVETTLLASQKPNDPNPQHAGNKFSDFGAISANQQGDVSANYEKSSRDVGPINSGYLGIPLHPQNINRVWQSDNQGPANSLNVPQTFCPPLQKSQQNHSLLQQVQAVSNSNLDEQSLYRHTVVHRNQMGSLVNSPSQFQAGNEASLLVGARESNVMNELSSNQPNLHNNAFQEMDKVNRLGHFHQYGNLKDGQMMVSESDPRIAKTTVEQLSLKAYHGLNIHNERVSSAIANKMDNALPNAVPNTDTIPFASSSDTAEQSLVARPKKRKTATSDFLPWHKEITQSSQRFQYLSMAEIEWAQATNRLTEKIEHKTLVMEYVNPLIRSKRRLIMTTQLMQQLLPSPPAAIISLNATLCFDSVAYFVSKLSLGDACSLTYFQKSDYQLPQDTSNTMVEKLTTSTSVEDHYFSKVMEAFTARTTKLENEFLRLEKKPSIVDLQVEFQELEKISIINRFAKFHMRGQAYAAENPSSSNAPPKMFLQRYVTPIPMPRKLPEELNCLSL